MKEWKKPDPALRKLLPPQKLREGAYRRSRFALPYERDGKTLWFHTVTRQLIEPEEALPETVSAEEIFDNPELLALAEAYYLVPSDKDECGFYTNLFRVLNLYVRPKGIGGYILLPTTACNARCVYCYEEGCKPETMTPETAAQVVRYIRRTKAPGQIALRWFGGEPLLAGSVMDAICAGLREAGVDFLGSMITNGSRVTEETVSRMKGLWNVTRVQVSMDGDAADYTARKRYAGNTDMYPRVLAGIRQMAEAGIRVSVRCNVDGENIHTLPTFLADLSRAVPDKECVRVAFTGLYQARGSEGSLELWKKISEARTLLRDYGFDGRDARFEVQEFRKHHCMADMGSSVIGPDGSLYACEHCLPESRFGSVWEETADFEKRARFAATDRPRPECRECAFLPECTAFASCPVRDADCIVVQQFRFRERMKHWLSEGKDSRKAAPENEGILSESWF